MICGNLERTILLACSRSLFTKDSFVYLHHKLKRKNMTLAELREQIQEDLLCLTDEYLIDELDGYEDFDDKICQIIVDNFNKFNDNGL